MGLYTVRQYFRDQRTKLPVPKAVDDVRSKTFIVTGSNVGLSFEASVHLASMRPKTLVATCRNQAKCEQTRESILKRATANGVSDAQVHTSPLELESFQNVRAFVDKFAADTDDALDVLLANAGVFPNGYTVTQDGWETTLQVNYLSTALLSILLLPYLINASSPESPSRLVIVSSTAHYFLSRSKEFKRADSWRNILETINRREYTSSDRYPISKLLQIIFVRELASRLPEPTPVVVCTAHPGFSKSNIFRAPLGRFICFVFGKLALIRSTEEGSRALVHAAVASDRSMHGRFLSCCQVTEELDFLFTPQGKAFSAKVWDETIMLLSGIDERVSDIVKKHLRVDS